MDKIGRTGHLSAYFLPSILLSRMLGWAADIEVTSLRCEYLENPQGIDTVWPRLSWNLESKENGQRQTAYQALVASSMKLLDKEKADLWDSGRVKSDQQIHIRYAGKPLTSRMRCYWKVRVWDSRRKKSK